MGFFNIVGCVFFGFLIKAFWLFWVSPSGQTYLVGCINWIQWGFLLNLFYIVGCIFGGSLFNIAGCIWKIFWGFPSNLTYVAGCIFGVPPQSSLILRVVFVRFLGVSPQSSLILQVVFVRFFGVSPLILTYFAGCTFGVPLNPL